MTQSLTRFRDIPPKVNPNVKVLTSSCVEIVNIWTPLFAIARIAKTQEDSSMTFICMGQPSVSRLCQQTRQGQPGLRKYTVRSRHATAEAGGAQLHQETHQAMGQLIGHIANQRA